MKNEEVHQLDGRLINRLSFAERNINHHIIYHSNETEIYYEQLCRSPKNTVCIPTTREPVVPCMVCTSLRIKSRENRD